MGTTEQGTARVSPTWSLSRHAIVWTCDRLTQTCRQTDRQTEANGGTCIGASGTNTIRSSALGFVVRLGLGLGLRARDGLFI